MHVWLVKLKRTGTTDAAGRQILTTTESAQRTKFHYIEQFTEELNVPFSVDYLVENLTEGHRVAELAGGQLIGIWESE